jgi:hypothetical protein
VRSVPLGQSVRPGRQVAQPFSGWIDLMTCVINTPTVSISLTAGMPLLPATQALICVEGDSRCCIGSTGAGQACAGFGMPQSVATRWCCGTLAVLDWAYDMTHGGRGLSGQGMFSITVPAFHSVWAVVAAISTDALDRSASPCPRGGRVSAVAPELLGQQVTIRAAVDRSGTLSGVIHGLGPARRSGDFTSSAFVR